MDGPDKKGLPRNGQPCDGDVIAGAAMRRRERMRRPPGYATGIGHGVRTGDATRIRALSAHEMAGLQPSFFLRTPYGIRKGC